MAPKRMRYSDSDAAESASDSASDYEVENNTKYNSSSRKQRTPKSFSRNALMARENRLRKKLYLENIERELAKERQKNKKNSNIMKRQAEVIEKQQRDIKYMRAVIANNTEISKLLRTIHNNTGLPIGTSLNKDFTIRSNKMVDNYASNVSIDSSVVSCNSEISELTHPWSDSQLSFGGLSPAHDLNVDALFDDFTLPTLDMPGLDLPDTDAFLDMQSPLQPSLDDHTYTIPSEEASESDHDQDSLGVCLHISNRKVSLEYCAQCHDNSKQLWSEVDAF